jgi:DNA-binding response OmpR family regulator
MRILVVEDEKELASAISRGLRKQGFAADTAYDGEEALFKVEVNDYDLIVLDLNLPKVNGVEVCQKIRASGSNTGILMLTARAGPDDRTMGLEQGADDYLVKPFYFPELLARVRAILRRKGERRDIILKTGDLAIDANTLKCYFREYEVSLTVREFSILEYLMRNAGRIVSQEELLEHVWGEDANIFTQAIKVHVGNIRRKMQKVGAGDMITTVKGRGYMI